MRYINEYNEFLPAKSISKEEIDSRNPQVLNKSEEDIINNFFDEISKEYSRKFTLEQGFVIKSNVPYLKIYKLDDDWFIIEYDYWNRIKCDSMIGLIEELKRWLGI